MSKIFNNQNNEPISCLTHFIGVILSIAGLVIMVIFASFRGTVWHIVGFSIFGLSLILLYLSSTLYHFFSKEKNIKNIFQKIDHSMIFVLIAGTYTPICLTIDNRTSGWILFGLIWGTALFGIIVKAFGIKIKKWVSTLNYVLMGWMAVLIIKPLLEWLHFNGFFWLLLGGILYTVGAIFYSLEYKVKKTRWFGMHEIFHLFVLGGSFCHFWLMLKYVVYL